MISEVTMPSMGADMTEGTIVKWLKAEGDQIGRGDKLAEVETDKTVVEMEAYAEGLLRKIVVSEGSLVQVGAVIAFIGDADDDIPEVAAAAPAAEAAPEAPAATPAPTPTPEPVQQAALAPVAVPASQGRRIKASPIARKIAEEKGVDIAAITGTGPGGRITKSDVENFTPSPGFAVSGGRSPVVLDGSDTPRYAALRDALGDEVKLMDDPHAVFDPPSALEVARLLEPYRLLFLEEPTIPEDPEGYARVRQGTTTPIAGSERLTSKHRFNDFFRAGAIDVAQPDPVYIGGITEMKKVCALAETYQVAIAPHNTKGPVGIMAAAHVMAAIPNALILEFISPSRIPWRNDVLKHPLVLADSRLQVPDRPGLGVEFDEAALKPHLVE